MASPSFVMLILSYYHTVKTYFVQLEQFKNFKRPLWQDHFNMHRAGQRCFELLALIGSPQLYGH